MVVKLGLLVFEIEADLDDVHIRCLGGSESHGSVAEARRLAKALEKAIKGAVAFKGEVAKEAKRRR